MKAFQIEDAKTRFFKTKEDYLKFKQAWKDFHNNQPLVEWKDKDISPWNRDQTLDPILARTKYPVLSSAHYMLYNLVRGYDIKHGYSPLTNEGRLNANLLDGAQPWRNCEAAATDLIRHARSLSDVNSQSKTSREYRRKDVEHMLLPFGDAFSHEALADLAGLLYKHLSGKDLPEIIVQEWKEIEEPPVKQSIADKLKAWRTV
jgi:hypothetical protein